MTTILNANGRARKSLSEQIDRLDGILDGLAKGLTDAVADAVKQAVGLAVEAAVRGVLTEVLSNPSFLNRAARQPRRADCPGTPDGRFRRARVAGVPRCARGPGAGVAGCRLAAGAPGVRRRDGQGARSAGRSVWALAADPAISLPGTDGARRRSPGGKRRLFRWAVHRGAGGLGRRLRYDARRPGRALAAPDIRHAGDVLHVTGNGVVMGRTVVAQACVTRGRSNRSS